MTESATPVAARKKERLEARVTAEQKAQIKQAASLMGRSLSEFVVDSAQQNAARVIADHKLLALSARDSAAFVQALLKPAAPTKRLRRAAKRYEEVMG